jgi:catechol 2,3-dioxygenase-like lactoylglutathione lyase family enzyme
MKVVGLDHLVLTVASIEQTVAFYCGVLGMTLETFGPQRRTALRFGPHKINLHQADNTFDPKAVRPTPGSGDLCFLVDDVEAVMQHLEAHDVPVLVPPSMRTGARGPIRSVYCRDPDGNLIELSAYPDGTTAAS